MAAAVDLRGALNDPASSRGREIPLGREPGGNACHRRSCSTFSSTFPCWIELMLLRYVFSQHHSSLNSEHLEKSFDFICHFTGLLELEPGFPHARTVAML